jgi:hypothetical protein
MDQLKCPFGWKGPNYSDPAEVAVYLDWLEETGQDAERAVMGWAVRTKRVPRRASYRHQLVGLPESLYGHPVEPSRDTSGWDGRGRALRSRASAALQLLPGPGPWVYHWWWIGRTRTYDLARWSSCPHAIPYPLHHLGPAREFGTAHWAYLNLQEAAREIVQRTSLKQLIDYHLGGIS